MVYEFPADVLSCAQQLSGALDIPLTRLFGQSPAGLNSTGESDIRNYYDGINQQQENSLREGIERLLRISYQSKFGKPIKAGSDFTFRALWQMSDAEKATIAATVTTAVTSAVTSGVAGQQTALKELRQSSRITGIWTNITDEAIRAASDETNPGGEFGEADPFGEEEPGKKKTKDTGGWNEGDHPRADNGEFSEGGSGTSGAFGPIFHEYSGRPAEAIQKLIQEKTGEVPAAWIHPQLGSVDLVWGNERGGLRHIVEKHVQKQKDLKLEDLADMIPNMPMVESDGRTAKLLSTSHRASVRLDYDGAQKRWLVSAFERTRG